jgi:hypothetical protein
MERRKDLIKRAYAWIHFGANIGAPQQPNLLQASDDALEQWAVAAMEREGLTVNRKAERGSIPSERPVPFTVGVGVTAL